MLFFTRMRLSTLLSLGTTLALSNTILAQVATDTGLPDPVTEANSAPYTPDTGRYIVQFSKTGVTKLKRRDGSTVSVIFSKDIGVV